VAAVVILAGWFAVHAVRVGVLTPWTPIVRTAPAPCDLLAGVDLDRAWPAAAGQLSVPATQNPRSHFCYAESRTAPDYTISLLELECARGDLFGSPIHEAIDDFARRRGRVEQSVVIPGADDAYIDDSGHTSALWVRKANCSVLIQVDQDGVPSQDLIPVAQRVAAGVLAGLRPE
jgi:hypothetical protein